MSLLRLSRVEIEVDEYQQDPPAEGKRPALTDFLKAEESAEIDRIPGTHASCSLLANLVFNKYHMNTPVYRKMLRLLNNKMNVIMQGRTDYERLAMPLCSAKNMLPMTNGIKKY